MKNKQLITIRFIPASRHRDASPTGMQKGIVPAFSTERFIPAGIKNHYMLFIFHSLTDHLLIINHIDLNLTTAGSAYAEQQGY